MYITNFEMNNEILALTGKAMAVLNNLIYRSNSKTNSCFPGLKTIAKECRISVRSVQRGLEELLEAGIIQKKHNFRENGSQTTNIYTIILKAAERIKAAKENAMQKLSDMRKRFAQQKENSKQERMTLDKNGEIRPAYQGKKVKNIITKIAETLKITHLAMGGSQSGYPITQNIKY